MLPSQSTNTDNTGANNDYLTLNDPSLFKLLPDNLRYSFMPVNPLLSSLNAPVPISVSETSNTNSASNGLLIQGKNATTNSNSNNDNNNKDNINDNTATNGSSIRLLDDINVQPSTVLQFNPKGGDNTSGNRIDGEQIVGSDNNKNDNNNNNNIPMDFGTNGSSYRDFIQTPSLSLAFQPERSNPLVKTTATSDPTLGVPFQNEYLLPSPEQLKELMLDSPVALNLNLNLNLNLLQTRTPSKTPLRFFTEYTATNKCAAATTGIDTTTTPSDPGSVSNLIHLFNSVEAQLQQQEQFNGNTTTTATNSSNNGNNNGNFRTASNTTFDKIFNRTPLKKLDINLMFGSSGGISNSQMWPNSISPSKKTPTSLTPFGKKGSMNGFGSPYYPGRYGVGTTDENAPNGNNEVNMNSNLGKNTNMNMNINRGIGSNSALVYFNRARKDVAYNVHQRSPLRNSETMFSQLSFGKTDNGNSTGTLVKTVALTPPGKFGKYRKLQNFRTPPAKQKSKRNKGGKPNGNSVKEVVVVAADGKLVVSGEDNFGSKIEDKEDKECPKENSTGVVSTGGCRDNDNNNDSDNCNEHKVSPRNPETHATESNGNDVENGDDMYDSSPTTIQLNSSATKSITDGIEPPLQFINNGPPLRPQQPQQYRTTLDLGNVAVTHLKPREYVLDFSSKRVPLILSPTLRKKGSSSKNRTGDNTAGNGKTKKNKRSERKETVPTTELTTNGTTLATVSNENELTPSENVPIPELPKMGSFKRESLSSGNSLKAPNFQSSGDPAMAMGSLLGQIPLVRPPFMDPYQQFPSQIYAQQQEQGQEQLPSQLQSHARLGGRMNNSKGNSSITRNKNSNLSLHSATSTLALSVNQRIRNRNRSGSGNANDDNNNNNNHNGNKRSRPKEPKFQVFVSSIHRFNEMNGTVQLSTARKLARRGTTGGGRTRRKRQKVSSGSSEGGGKK